MLCNNCGPHLSDTPGPCKRITITGVTERKCTVSWEIPMEEGGDPVSHYIVERRDTNRLNWVIVEAECKTLSCIITNMIKNVEYVFRVRGVNKYGPGVPLQSESIIARNLFSKYSFYPFYLTDKFGLLIMLFSYNSHPFTSWST